MFTFHEKDNHKISSPAKMHLPIPSEVTQSQIFDLPDIRNQDVPPHIQNLMSDGSKFNEIACAWITWDIRESIWSSNQD
jgi:hypothetical protein